MTEPILTPPTSRESGRIRRFLIPVAWIALGAVIAVFFVRDPLGVLPSGESAQVVEAHEHASAGEQLWTCGMHPEVIMDEPGQCPICGMDLVPLAAQSEPEEASVADPELWTCGMHPEVIMEEPGQCPICSMDLVPVDTGEAEHDHGTMASMSGLDSGEREIVLYRNPMNPTVTSPVPMKDEMGMEYVPVYQDELDEAAGSGTTVRIDPAVVQNMNVLMEPVTRRNIHSQIRTVGYLEYDQEKMVSVTTKFTGWVEKVYVNYIGQPVRKGQPLFDIYSPELVQTQQELLSAIAFAKRMEGAREDAKRQAEALTSAARSRLAYWDISTEQTNRLIETGNVVRTLTVNAPSTGLVMKRMDGLEGMAVRPGMQLFHIADLSSLWLSVEVFENQLPLLREGIAAKVTLDYLASESFTGKVRYIDPQVNEKTRTVSLKVAVPNPDGKLRAGMYATVVFDPKTGDDVLAVPSLSVIRTGQRNLIILADGEGRFTPREVVLGAEGGGYVEIRSGVRDGEIVVTSSQFLLDSESNLREAIQKLIAAKRRGAANAQ